MCWDFQVSLVLHGFLFVTVAGLTVGYETCVKISLSSFVLDLSHVEDMVTDQRRSWSCCYRRRAHSFAPLHPKNTKRCPSLKNELTTCLLWTDPHPPPFSTLQLPMSYMKLVCTTCNSYSNFLSFFFVVFGTRELRGLLQR